MSLISFVTPFLQELRGIFSISTHIGGSVKQFEILGSAFIEKGFAKLKEVIHPLQDIKADFLFSQKKLIVNNFSGQLAGGRLFTDGTIEFEGFRNFPTKLKIKLEETDLKIPEDINSYGSGEIIITGKWFPFLLSGIYKIDKGLMTRNFDDKKIETEKVRRSSFLPKLGVEDKFEPISLDLLINLGQAFRVKNEFIDTLIDGEFQLQGTPSFPILLGDLTARKGGKILFKDHPFEIISTNIKFEDPEKINPIIYTLARAQISSSRKEKTYRIDLLVQGTKEKYKLTLTSEPGLPELQIIQLLILGFTSEEAEAAESEITNPSTESSKQSERSLLYKEFSKRLFKELPQILGLNLSLSAAEDASGPQTTVTLSRDWGDNITTTIGRKMESPSKNDVRLRYRINSLWSSFLNYEQREFDEETTGVQQESTTSSDTFGLGIEYRLEFK